MIPEAAVLVVGDDRRHLRFLRAVLLTHDNLGDMPLAA
jgi:hypothetical protein